MNIQSLVSRNLKTFTLSILVSSLFFSSCQKSNNSENDNAINFKTIDPIESIILSFKSKMDNVRQATDIKSGDEVINKDSAIWYLEAAINYTYDEINNDNWEIFWDTLNYFVQIENESLNLDQLTIIYDEFTSNLLEEDEYLYLADLYIVEDGNKSSEIEIKMISGKGLQSPPTNSSIYCGPIGPEDYWTFTGTQIDVFSGTIYDFPSLVMGICAGPNQNLEMNRGSTDEFSRRLNLDVQNNFCITRQITFGTYFTDIETFYVTPTADSESPQVFWIDDDSGLMINTNDPIPGDEVVDFLIFYRELSEEDLENGGDCLSPDEMNFYAFEGLPQLIENIRPENKEYLKSWISSNFITQDQMVDIPYFHEMGIVYGVRHAGTSE